MSLLQSISSAEINKIIPNRDLKIEYLTALSAQTGAVFENLYGGVGIDDLIINSWDYAVSKNILRSLFRHTDKYNYNRNCRNRVNDLTNEWVALGLGDIEWPFAPRSFDQYVHSLNRRTISEEEKDQIITDAVIKFRRIKDLNAARNDYIEYLIFENNENIIPTFANVRGVDFYIDGNPFDQKVSKSVTRQFENDYGDNYRQIAIEHPELVAQCLYKYQDEERFGYEPRLFVIYLDSDLSIDDIENSIRAVNFNRPLDVEFEYAHSRNNVRTYTTHCYVILLHR